MYRSMPVRVRRAAFRLTAATFAVLSMCAPSASAAQVALGPDTLVYHQITDLGDDVFGVAAPELSADGQVAVFADAPGTGDELTPNRIFTLAADGGPLTEVDSYKTLCYCSSHVDINEDGSVVVSSDSVQLRVASQSGGRELLVLTSNELGPIRLNADGDTVFFLVRRATTTVGGDPIPRGVWAIDTDGENLRHIVSAADIDAVMDTANADTACCFYSDGLPLDVSASGDQIVFNSYGPLGVHAFAVAGDGGNLRNLAGPFAHVPNLAISADGDTVALHTLPLDGGVNQISVLPFTGGEPEVLASNTGSNFADVLRLSDDGSALLVNPSGLLIDTETGDTRQLAIATPGGDGHTAVLADGMPRASMNADATRVLYAMNTIRCADCANQHEQLAILDIGPADSGNAPQIIETSIDPDELTIGADGRATATVEVAYDGEIISVGVVALLDGITDINVARSAVLLDDGTLGDARSSDDIYSNNTLAYIPVVAREDDTGPRTMRFQAEIIGPDGLRHAIAVDATTLIINAGS